MKEFPLIWKYAKGSFYLSQGLKGSRKSVIANPFYVQYNYPLNVLFIRNKSPMKVYAIFALQFLEELTLRRMSSLFLTL